MKLILSASYRPRTMIPEAVFRGNTWENPQETDHFRPKSVGKCEELDVRIQ